MKAQDRSFIGATIIVVLAIIPVFFWLGMKPLAGRFSSFYLVMTSIGQLTGLVGMVLFSTSLVLASRNKYLEKIFFGLNDTYINHHIIGGIAFILLLWHPITLAMRYAPLSIIAAATFLIPSMDNVPVAYGIFSLILMIILLWLTFYVRPKYHIWKSTHKFLGLAFFIAGLHVFLIPSDVSRSYGLRFYMLAIAFLGLAAIFYRTILDMGKKWKYKVNYVKELMPGSLFEIDLAPAGEQMPFLPGQFIFISFRGKGISAESHPFSLASSPKEKNIKIIVKNLGDYTKNMKGIMPGTEAVIQGPFGQFDYRNFSEEQIWIAGGIGIVPFLSMAKDFQTQGKHKIHLFYSVGKAEEGIHSEYFDSLTKGNVSFKFRFHDTSKDGFITAQKISQLCGDVKNKEVLICGPVPMMASLKKQFLEIGVSKKNIHTEEFML